MRGEDRGVNSKRIETGDQRTRSGSGPSDAALVVAAQGGERWAQEALFRRYAKMVNSLAYRLVPWETEAEDLVQDSFVQALDSLARLREPQAFEAWLRSIVVRTAVKRIRRRRLLVRLGLVRRKPIEIDMVVSPSAPPDIAAELSILYLRIHEFSAEYRVMLILRYVDGLSILEIARQTGVSQGTVKRRIRKAKRMLESPQAQPQPQPQPQRRVP